MIVKIGSFVLLAVLFVGICAWALSTFSPH